MELDPGSFVAVQMVRAYLLNDSLLIASYIKHRLVHNFVVADQINFMDLLTWIRVIQKCCHLYNLKTFHNRVGVSNIVSN